MTPDDRAVLDEAGLSRLFDALHSRGYETVGPRARAGAIVHDTLASAAELPDDLRQLVPKSLGLPEEELQWRCEQTVRNYDPRDSWATRFLELRVERT